MNSNPDEAPDLIPPARLTGTVFFRPPGGAGEYRETGRVTEDGVAFGWPAEQPTSAAEWLLRQCAGLRSVFSAHSTHPRSESSYRAPDNPLRSRIEDVLNGGVLADRAGERRSGPADVLEQIDRAVDDLCPCGAAPSEQFAPYCSYDCKPNWRGPDTTSGSDGTPMRWRPDLVTAVDNSGLVALGSNTFYDGPYRAQLFQRGPEVDGAATWHLRLDDGHRFVGVDLSDVRQIDTDLRGRLTAKWSALERQLGNGRYALPDNAFAQATVGGSLSSSLARAWLRFLEHPDAQAECP